MISYSKSRSVLPVCVKAFNSPIASLQHVHLDNLEGISRVPIVHQNAELEVMMRVAPERRKKKKKKKTITKIAAAVKIHKQRHKLASVVILITHKQRHETTHFTGSLQLRQHSRSAKSRS